MPLDKKKVERALRKKGFRAHEGDHHVSWYYTRDGLKTAVRTKTSHAAKRNISDGLVAAMARQCSLTSRQFHDLVNCPLDRGRFEELLEEQGKV